MRNGLLTQALAAVASTHVDKKIDPFEVYALKKDRMLERHDEPWRRKNRRRRK